MRLLVPYVRFRPGFSSQRQQILNPAGQNPGIGSQKCAAGRVLSGSLRRKQLQIPRHPLERTAAISACGVKQSPHCLRDGMSTEPFRQMLLKLCPAPTVLKLDCKIPALRFLVQLIEDMPQVEKSDRFPDHVTDHWPRLVCGGE